MSRAPFVALALAAALAGCPTASPVAAGSPSPLTGMPSGMPTVNANETPTTSAAGAVRVAGTDATPWAIPVDTLDRIHAAGLTELAAESFNYHVHSHLDVFVNGQKVVVPGLIGIATKEPFFISPMHTHDTTGVIHIEATEAKDFKLSQFMTEWGVSLQGFKLYVAGQPVAGNDVFLPAHTVVALVYGTPPDSIPSTYDFNGL